MKKLAPLLLITLIFAPSCILQGQEKHTPKANERWQQAAKYFMEVDMDVKTNRFQGIQKLEYTNNSPDVLNKVFYHLYYNAFQPNSMMDTRSRNIADPDPRVGERIFHLKENEIGYQKIKSLHQDGKEVSFEAVGTILEVALNQPIQPGQTVTFDMVFEAQVPLQIRRTGRDNAEGVRYSMAQWYPKMCEYDYQGWHANPYVGREFHGVWGDFDIKITIDKDYLIGGTGYLQNPQEIGYGYEEPGMTVSKKIKKGKLTWHFKAPQVHDFMWAADPEYVHIKKQIPGGAMLHFFHKKGQNEEAWKNIPDITMRAMQYANKYFGKYPYKQFTVIQGGDGGMEYPMSTLINGSKGDLIGVTIHEMMHDWYHGVLGNNESLYPWMDEGFTSYATARIREHLQPTGPGSNLINSLGGNFGQGSYLYGIKNGKEEPLSTHADHYNVNLIYSTQSYGKGAVWMSQMGYVIGEKARDKALLQYFEDWKFKHPNANDLLRVFEKVSDLELDWYNEYFVYTTKQIDYGVKSVQKQGQGTKITLEKVGKMPMPIDLVITYNNGDTEIHYMPLQIMRGEKPAETGDKRIVHEDWPWTHPTYELIIEKHLENIQSIEIDPSGRMADANRDNNRWGNGN